MPSAGRSSCFFFLFSTSSPNKFKFAFLALKVASQAYTWKISICLAKIDHVFRCSLSGELTTKGARLRTAVRGAASQLQLTEPKEQRVAQRGLCAKAWKSELKSSPGPAILFDMLSVSRPGSMSKPMPMRACENKKQSPQINNMNTRIPTHAVHFSFP